MQLYKELEKICKLRIFSNTEIPAYLKRYSQYGKLDLVKQIELLTLVLDRVGKIEDELEVIRQKLEGKTFPPVAKAKEVMKEELPPEKELLEEIADKVEDSLEYQNRNDKSSKSDLKNDLDEDLDELHTSTGEDGEFDAEASQPSAIVNGEAGTTELKPETFPCDKCESVAQNKAGLSAHKRAKHPEEKV